MGYGDFRFVSPEKYVESPGVRVPNARGDLWERIPSAGVFRSSRDGCVIGNDSSLIPMAAFSVHLFLMRSAGLVRQRENRKFNAP